MSDIETMGKILGKQVKSHMALDNAWVTSKDGCPEHDRLCEKVSTANRSMDGLRDAIMSLPATDLTGGAIQLMLAFGHADILRTSIVDQDYQEEMATQIQDPLVSVIAMLCKKGGIDLYQYGGEYYFFPAKNPIPVE